MSFRVGVTVTSSTSWSTSTEYPRVAGSNAGSGERSSVPSLTTRVLSVTSLEGFLTSRTVTVSPTVQDRPWSGKVKVVVVPGASIAKVCVPTWRVKSSSPSTPSVGVVPESRLMPHLNVPVAPESYLRARTPAVAVRYVNVFGETVPVVPPNPTL